jgi:hypothetical protein
LPEARSEFEGDLFDALTVIFLWPPAATRARTAVRAAVGDVIFELLIAYLAFIRTAHYWTETHPHLEYEVDVQALLGGHAELAALLLDTSEAELIEGGLKLRETLQILERARVELPEPHLENRRASVARHFCVAHEFVFVRERRRHARTGRYSARWSPTWLRS